MDKMTKTAQVQRALLAGETLTQLNAFQRFKCTRLAARVHNLNKRQMDIESTLVMVKDSDGKIVSRYSTYHIPLDKLAEARQRFGHP